MDSTHVVAALSTERKSGKWNLLLAAARFTPAFAGKTDHFL